MINRPKGFVQVIGNDDDKKYIRCSTVTKIEEVQNDIVDFYTAEGFAGRGHLSEFNSSKQSEPTIIPAPQGWLLLTPCDGEDGESLASLLKLQLIAIAVWPNGHYEPLTDWPTYTWDDEWAILYPDGTAANHGERYTSAEDFLQCLRDRKTEREAAE